MRKKKQTVYIKQDQHVIRCKHCTATKKAPQDICSFICHHCLFKQQLQEDKQLKEQLERQQKMTKKDWELYIQKIQNSQTQNERKKEQQITKSVKNVDIEKLMIREKELKELINKFYSGKQTKTISKKILTKYQKQLKSLQVKKKNYYKGN